MLDKSELIEPIAMCLYAIQCMSNAHFIVSSLFHLRSLTLCALYFRINVALSIKVLLCIISRGGLRSESG